MSILVGFNIAMMEYHMQMEVGEERMYFGLYL